MKPTAAHRELWAELWRTPQAVAWDRLGWTRVVARYVLVTIEAEHELEAKALAEARQLEDRLGLTPKAMRTLLWSVVEDETAEKRGSSSTSSRAASTTRRRLRAVDDPAAG